MLENINRAEAGLPVASTAGKAIAQRQSRVGAHTRLATLIAVAVVALAIWLPRAFQLDHFVTIDESKWLVRAGNFYQAVESRTYENTFQHGHPGVTIMYAGLAGYLWRFPDYIEKVGSQQLWSDEFAQALESNGHQPIDMLAAGRTFIVLFNVIALSVAFVYAINLLGFLPALLGFLLIAFDPFQTALSRFLHPDSLLSPFMLLAAFALMHYLFAGRRLRDLIVAGAVTGLAMLTKTPAIFLLPLAGLFCLIELADQITSRPGWRWREFLRWSSLSRILRTLLIWGGVAALVFVTLWPAMWVAPWQTISQVFGISAFYATSGHGSPVFFNGTIYNGNPGADFYPINFLWRTTPVVMLGILLLIPGFWLTRRIQDRRVRLTALGIASMAFFFMVFMSLGAKKFDRYLLPVFMPVDLLAALGLAMVAQRLFQARSLAWMRGLTIALLAVAVGAQAWQSLPLFPYYMDYYNPVMGGPAKAPDVMFIGWGEGLDEAARYLNDTIDVKTNTVASWYERGPFSYFYKGLSTPDERIWEADYSVLYRHQWQRELPTRRMLSNFDQLTPEKSIWLNDMEYVRVYDMQKAPPADYMVEWNDALRLVFYENDSGSVYPGMWYDVNLFFLKTAPVDVNYNMLMRVVNPAGDELIKVDEWPKGWPTTQLQVGQVLTDVRHGLFISEVTPVGPYRIEVSFYDPATFDRLPARSVRTGQPAADPYVLDYMVVGDWPLAPAGRISPAVNLGDQVELYGADLVQPDGTARKLDDVTVAPGESLTLRLNWKALDFIHQDYTVFVHLVGPDGRPIVQGDSQPMHGFIPTSYWPPHQKMADDHMLTIPADAAPGEYRLLVGWYDLESLQRLPMTQGQKAIGDAYQVATVTVQAAAR